MIPMARTLAEGPGIPGPHLHAGFTKDRWMVGTLGAMAPLALLAGLALGPRAAVHLALGLGTALLLHLGLALGERIVRGRVLHPSWTSSLVAGAIAALSSLAVAPYAVTAGIAALAVVLKFAQGWVFGRKYLNPVAAAKVLLLGLMTATLGLERGLMYHPHHLDWIDMWTREGFEGGLWFLAWGDWGPGLSLLLWKTHTWMGGVSGLATLFVGGLSAWLLRYKWRIPVSFLGTMGLLALLLAWLTRGDPLLRLAFHLFTGSVIFLAFFMATEPQSTPMSAGGQYLFGVGLGILTFLLQQLNVLGGSVLALVAMNLFTPLLDRVGLGRPVGLTRREHGR